MKFRIEAALLVFVVVAQTGTLQAEEDILGAHGLSVHDLLAMDRISDPRVSLDGTRIVFVRRTTDLEANRGRTDLWLVNVSGADLRRLTSHPAGEHNPRWSPDGKTIYFISSRSEKAQVWKIR